MALPTDMEKTVPSSSAASTPWDGMVTSAPSGVAQFSLMLKPVGEGRFKKYPYLTGFSYIPFVMFCKLLKMGEWNKYCREQGSC
jgi:hypothetical protein